MTGILVAVLAKVALLDFPVVLVAVPVVGLQAFLLGNLAVIRIKAQAEAGGAAVLIPPPPHTVAALAASRAAVQAARRGLLA